MAARMTGGSSNMTDGSSKTGRLAGEAHAAVEDVDEAGEWGIRVERASARVDGWIETYRRPLLALLFLAFVVHTYGQSIVKPLWFDELFSIHLVQHLTAFGLWDALLHGLDTLPPMTVLLQRASLLAFGDHVIVYRLNAMAGVWLMALALYWCVRRRQGASFAFAAMLVALLTPAGWYAAEGRPYGLLLGFGTGAFACWLAAIRHERRRVALVGLACCLAAGFFTHYYVVFIIPPMIVGLAVTWWRERRVDWGVLVAIGAGALVLVPLIPTIRAGSTISINWAVPTLAAILDCFRANLQPAFGVFMAAGAAVTVLVPRCWRASERRSAGFDATEWAAIVTLCLTPVWAYILGRMATGALTPRYTLLMVPGFALAMVGAATAGRRRCRAAGLALLVAAGVVYGVQTLDAAHSILRQPQQVNVLIRPSEDEEEVVYTHPHAFLQDASAWLPRRRDRCLYLADPALSRRYIGHDTADVNLQRLATVSPLSVLDYASFVRSHRTFLMAWEDSDYAWLPKHLAREGARFEWVRPLRRDVILVRVVLP
jgi:hypothetical protein